MRAVWIYQNEETGAVFGVPAEFNANLQWKHVVSGMNRAAAKIAGAPVRWLICEAPGSLANDSVFRSVREVVDPILRKAITIELSQ